MPNFIFCIHNHQPSGNFGHVIEDSYKKAYLPFLKTIAKYPNVKLSFHITGYLLDWLLENHGEYIETLKQMVHNGQVEMMGGGYYEPILAVIPPRDRIGQIKMLSDKIEYVFGKRPRGMWLAERIWEPQLPVYLKDAGMEYVVVDDYHFIKSGSVKEKLAGYYVTEELGKTIKIFPGSETIRYLIPFEAVEKFDKHASWISGFGNEAALIFADDGEKFGTWPGTHQWVYKDGWLKKFLDSITEKKDFIKPTTFSEFMDNNEPIGRIYLPATSYMEMGEWALPSEAMEAYASLLNDIKGWRRRDERVKRFLQGGSWRNFLTKYPEANWMHKRMLMVSEEVERNGESKNLDSATSHLYRSQCNDAYWHGVFGGLYLPHLRTAIYENLINAENIIEGLSDKTSDSAQITIQEKDFDTDSFNEIFIRTPTNNIFLSPQRGGSILELDYRPKAVNLSNILSRWEEGYHHKVRDKHNGKGAGNGEAKSIHDLSSAKEEELYKYLYFDKKQRLSLVDHFIKKEETLDRFRMSTYEELGNFTDGRYENLSEFMQKNQEGAAIIFCREGKVNEDNLQVEKHLFVKRTEIEIKYSVSKKRDEKIVNLGDEKDIIISQVSGSSNSSQQPPEQIVRFGVEFNLIFPCCNGPACFYEMPGKNLKDKRLGSSGEITNIRDITLVDKLTKVSINFSFENDVSLWRFPIETVSISEAGFERIFQGSCLLFFWDISIDRGFETRFTIKTESL